MRAVVYVLVLLVVIGMILTMVGSALAAAVPTGQAGPAGPAEPAHPSSPPSSAVAEASTSSPARSFRRQPPDAGRARVLTSPVSSASSPAAHGSSAANQSSRPTPVVVLGTNNLTWADLQSQASGTAAGISDAGAAAAHLLTLASQGEPMNLSVRTPADRTCPADGWLTLGRGSRASAVKPAVSCAGASATTADSSVSPLVRALGHDVSIQAVGPGARLATGAPGNSPNASVSLAPSLPEALSTGADLTIVDTAEVASTDADRISALDKALRTVQEQARPGTRIVIASLADDEDPGPQMAVLPSGTTSARGASDGLVVGTSTHRPGLAQLTDLAPTLTVSLAGRSDPAFDGRALEMPPGASAPNPTAAPDDSRIVRLADDALHARASQATVIPASALLVGAAVMLLVWAAVVLRDPGAGRRSAVRCRVAGAATFLGALPTALLLVNTVPWWRVGVRAGSPSLWMPAAALTAAVVVAACVVGLAAGIATLVRRGRQLRSAASPVPSPSALGATPADEAAGSAAVLSARGDAAAEPQQDEADSPMPSSSSSPPSSGASLTTLLVVAAIPLAWLTDAAAGAHLAFNNPLGMNAVVAGRFYGASNTAFALAAGALVVVIVGVWEALGRGRRTALLVTSVLGGAALVADGAPQLGADVGGALTLVPTLAFLGAGLAGLRLSWRRWLAIGATTVLVVGGFAAVDLIRPGGPTHLGRFARQVADGSALGVVERKAYALVGPFVTRPAAAAGLACALVLLTAALWWLRRQVRSWRAGTSPYAWLAPAAHGDIPHGREQVSGSRPRGMSPSVQGRTVALKSLGVLTLVSVLVNDSGVTMAGFILAAAAPTLLALTLLRSDSPHRLSISADAGT